MKIASLLTKPESEDANGLDLGPLARHPKPMLIYKILRAPEWAQLQAESETAGAPIDVTDGYIHFSTADQAQETATKHFAGEDGLILLAFEAEALSPLRWEPSRGGALFPHLYGPLRLADVLWSKTLPLVDDTHEFPAEFA